MAFRVLVSDDASTDSTGELIKGFIQKYPDRISHHRNPTNLDTYGSLQNIMAKCTAEYIAILEGDDYWNHPEKLKMQIDFLQIHENYVACAGLSKVYNEETEKFEGDYNKLPKTDYELKDLFGVPPFQIGTLVFRRSALEPLPDIFKGTISNDKIVYTLLAQNGPVYCFDQMFSVYRIHRGSISKTNTPEKIYEYHERLYEAMKKHFGSKWFVEIEKARYLHFRAFLKGMIQENKWAINYFTKFASMWFRLSEWKTLNGWKDFFYMAINML